MENTPKNQLDGKTLLLGIQHLFAMFGATVLVPALTGMNPAIALVTAGIGTFVFHWITKRRVPVFVGSSFAFIPAIQTILGTTVNLDGTVTADLSRLPAVQGGIMVAGLVYVLLSVLVYSIGIERIRSFFPPLVTGPVIVVIGLTLSPTAIANASQNWVISILTLAVVIAVHIFAKGFWKLIPILLGITSGYLLSMLYDFFFPSSNLIPFSVVANAPWISPFWDFTLPQFELDAILLLGPIALVTFMEHIGDITTNGSVVGEDFLKNPGLHRTILGDGAASIVAGLLGGPANTTYSENTGVLAVTKNYNPFILEVAAGMAILLGLFGKVGAVLQTIPVPVMGGVSILLFGMIASIGMRTLAEANLDFGNPRNLIVSALILVIGIGMSSGIQIGGVTISGLFLAVVAGALSNKLLPKEVL